MTRLLKRIKYYLGKTCIRKFIDASLEQNMRYFQGMVLDIGGGRTDAGRFVPPETSDYLIVDFVANLAPDVVASVECLPFRNQMFDTVRATELFEHVRDYRRGVAECVRVLKPGGHLIVTCPFLFPIHDDPCDFQRVSLDSWNLVAAQNHLSVVEFATYGSIFSIVADWWKQFVMGLPNALRIPLFATFPLTDVIAALGERPLLKRHPAFKGYVENYFFVFRKLTEP